MEQVFVIFKNQINKKAVMDTQTNIITVSKGISIFSWGEKVRLYPANEDTLLTTVMVESKPKFGILGLAVSTTWGMNKRNVDQITSILSNELGNGTASIHNLN